MGRGNLPTSGVGAKQSVRESMTDSLHVCLRKRWSPLRGLNQTRWVLTAAQNDLQVDR